jgi:hypothetical protein
LTGDIYYSTIEDSLQAPIGVSSQCIARPPSLARYFILNLYGDLYELYEKRSQLKKKIKKKKKRKKGPIKKSGNAAEAGEADRLQEARIFRFFCRSSFCLSQSASASARAGPRLILPRAPS